MLETWKSRPSTSTAALPTCCVDPGAQAKGEGLGGLCGGASLGDVIVLSCTPALT